MVDERNRKNQQRRRKNLQNEKNVKKLTAIEADEKLKNVKNYGGIVRLSDLKNLKIISYPVALLIHGYDHWIGIYISEKTVEIMDSSGIFSSRDIASSLQKFLCAQFYKKRFLCTPVLQSQSASTCGYYAVLFIFLRLQKNLSISNFSSMFSSDLANNDEIILDLYKCL